MGGPKSPPPPSLGEIGLNLASFSFLPVQEKIESFDDEQSDVDQKSTNIIDNCLSASVENAKLFEQALTPSTCKNCSNIIADINSKESLAAQVKEAQTALSSKRMFLLLHNVLVLPAN